MSYLTRYWWYRSVLRYRGWTTLTMLRKDGKLSYMNFKTNKPNTLDYFMKKMITDGWKEEK